MFRISFYPQAEIERARPLTQSSTAAHLAITQDRATSLKMHEESNVDNLLEKTFSNPENVIASASRHDLLEEVSFMTEASENPHRQHRWRRLLLPFCAHLFAFLIFSTLATLALDARSKAMQPKRHVLYCTCSSQSTSHLSDHFN